jgi:predicted alpha/beta hydrolase family esterase
MMKFAIAAAVAGMFSIAPAFADEMMKCDDANMMKMDKMVKETDPAMKKQMEMASGEMTMAMDAMKANKMDECEMHLNKAAMELKAK